MSASNRGPPPPVAAAASSRHLPAGAGLARTGVVNAELLVTTKVDLHHAPRRLQRELRVVVLRTNARIRRQRFCFRHFNGFLLALVPSLSWQNSRPFHREANGIDRSKNKTARAGSLSSLSTPHRECVGHVLLPHLELKVTEL